MPLPEFLVDRSLGRRQLPQALREQGLVVHTLWSVFGAAEEQLLLDDRWIAEAGRRGWFSLTADKRIRYDVSTQRLAAHRVGVFQLARGTLPGPEQVRWYVDNLPAILRACEEEPRPFIFSVHERSIEPVWPVLG